MPITENLGGFLRHYKKEHNLSISELSEELGVAKSALEIYLKGTGNPRADTIDLLAQRSGVSPAEIISAHPPGWERAEITERAARLFGDLLPERRERATKLFFDLIDLFSEEDQT